MEQTGQQTLGSARNRSLGDLVRALFEEAWRARRRRRLHYAGVAFSIAVVGAAVFATMRGPATSQTTSPAVGASPSAPIRHIAAAQRVYAVPVDLTGRRGSLTVYVYFGSDGRSWDLGRRSRDAGGRHSSLGRTGQYASIRAARGERVQAGGHADEWHARLVGVVTPTRQNAKQQRVVIELTGRPTGTFTLIPTVPGVLKRDSGTQSGRFIGPR